jgi:pyruvate kinase
LKKAVTSTAVPKQAKLEELIKRLSEIRLALSQSESVFESRDDRIDPTYLKSARNLAHYIALRHYDIRPMQEELASWDFRRLGEQKRT